MNDKLSRLKADNHLQNMAVLFESIRQVADEVDGKSSAMRSIGERRNIRRIMRKINEGLEMAQELYPMPDQVLEVGEDDLSDDVEENISDVDITPVDIDMEDIDLDEFAERSKSVLKRLGALRARRAARKESESEENDAQENEDDE